MFGGGLLLSNMYVERKKKKLQGNSFEISGKPGENNQ